MKDIPPENAAQLAVDTKERPTRKWLTSLDPLKFVAGAVAFLGIQAWMAGEVFMLGYWGAAHYPRGIAALSPQSLALLGFYGAYRCWMWAVAAIAGYGLLGLLSAVKLKRSHPRKPGWMRRVLAWIKNQTGKRLEIDTSSAVPGVLLLCAALVYYAVVISPTVLWIWGANYEGKAFFEKQACQARAGAAPTTMVLTDGSVLKGNVIERSDKLIALLTKDAVVMVADGEKGGRVVESTSLANLRCPAN